MLIARDWKASIKRKIRDRLPDWTIVLREHRKAPGRPAALPSDAKTLARLAFDNSGFCTEFPKHQNAVNLFDNWTCQLPMDAVKSGGTRLFSPEADPRPRYVSDVFGDISQFNILDLGSFEGAHSYQLCLMGAKSVLGIEARPSSYLKSLIAKEITGITAKFLLGDFVQYLQGTKLTYDLIFASGVLYHMRDPIKFIQLVSERTDRAFFWTHYVTEEESAIWTDSFMHQGHQRKYHRYYYPERADRGYAGVHPYCCRLTKTDILCALKTFGFDGVRIMLDEPGHPGGAAFSLVCYRTAKVRV